MIYLLFLIISLGMAGLEAFSYPGFVVNHLGISSYVFYILSVVFSSKRIKIPKILNSLFLIFGWLIAVIYIVLVFLEKVKYPNYVYTITHLNLLTFLFLVGFTWFHILRLKQLGLIKSLLIACLIYVGIDGAGRTLAVITNNLDRVRHSFFATYDQKMAQSYPGFYPAMQEVIKLTPSDATLLIPPQGNPWEVEGNAAMVTYFVYPRKVRNLDPNELTKAFPKNTYMLIAKGSWERKGDTDYGWPKGSVKANHIWQIDLVSHANYEYKRNYNPETDKWDWGIIEVNNE